MKHRNHSEKYHVRKRTKSLLALLLILALALAGLSGCSGKRTYKKEQNTGEHAATYPYVVRTPSVELYLAQEDIELLGEEEFYAGMNRLLENLEADFQDARDELKAYLRVEIPVIKIYTDFSGRTEHGRRPEFSGLYNDNTVDIHLFHNWDHAAVVLLHEYTHYLSIHCARVVPETDFWREALADYISKIRCKNRMAMDVNYGVTDEALDYYRERGAVTEDGKLDLKRFYYGTAAAYRMKENVGAPYLAVSQAATYLTEAQLTAPIMNEVSYYEAACIFEYLVDHYGEKTVFSNMNLNGKRMTEVYGKTFIEICEEWTAENLRKCEELGIILK